jgi:hypothetical protein
MRCACSIYESRDKNPPDTGGSFMIADKKIYKDAVCRRALVRLLQAQQSPGY